MVGVDEFIKVIKPLGGGIAVKNKVESLDGITDSMLEAAAQKTVESM